jgi:hypothetical protein
VFMGTKDRPPSILINRNKTILTSNLRTISLGGRDCSQLSRIIPDYIDIRRRHDMPDRQK